VSPSANQTAYFSILHFDEVLTIFGQWHIPRDHLSLTGGRGPGFFRMLRKQLQCLGRLFAELDSLTFHTPMQDSSRDGPRFSRGASNINANSGIFNQVGRDQYNHYNNNQYHNYSNAVNDDMVVRQSYQ
jgi:hypothetical protein